MADCYDHGMEQLTAKNRSDPLERESDGVPAIGYRRPPVHSRFKAGQSGNPSGRPKGSQNLKTLFNKILKEEVSLREGSAVRKVSKAEALMRGLIVGALKGDTRSLGTVFRFAEQTGQLDEPPPPITQITRVILQGVRPGADHPANMENNRDDEH